MSLAGLASALPLPVAVPLGGAIVSPLLGRRSGTLALAVGALSLAASGALLATVAPTVFGGRILVTFMAHAGPVHGSVLGDAFAADPLGLLFALAVAVIGALILVFALSELAALGRREVGSFACLFLLLEAALIGSALTADLINLFVWFEVAALASYALTAYFLERPLALEAAFKILVLTAMAGFFVFVGAAILYQDHGALNIAQLHRSLASQGVAVADLAALGLLLVGFGTKAGWMPFHTWLPDAHTAAPGSVSGLFSGLMVNLGVVAVARVAFQVFRPGHEAHALGLLMVIGCISAVLGAALALAQDDLKRLLAFDTVSQMGLLAIGLAIANMDGVTGAVYHLVNHALFKSLLFLSAGAVIHTTGKAKLSELGGLWRREPGITAAFLLGVAAIIGVPPLNGYASRELIDEGLLRAHQVLPFLAVSAAEVLTVAALARAVWLGFLRARPDPYERDEALPKGMAVSFLALGLLCLGFGVAPGAFVNQTMAPAASGLLESGRYASTVLGTPIHLAVPHVDAPLASAEGLVSTGVALALGLVLAWGWLRAPVGSLLRSPVQALRRVHTGSVNDYAALASGGLVVVVVFLEALRR